ncbi:MAG: hypothetical protein QM765_32980 [Myxococcales bacterium]
MRAQECPWCRESIDEASAGWEEALETGQCPFCRRFYDRAREAQAEEKVQRASHDPKLLAQIRKARIAAAFGGPSCVVLAVLALLLHLPMARYVAFVAIATAASLISFALNHDVRAEVRGRVGKLPGPETVRAAWRRGLFVALFFVGLAAAVYWGFEAMGFDWTLGR